MSQFRSSITVGNVHGGQVHFGDTFHNSEAQMSVDDHAIVLQRKMAAEARLRNAKETAKFKRQMLFPGIPLALLAAALFTYPQIFPMAINAVVHELMAPLVKTNGK